TATDQSKFIGTSNPALSYTIEGFAEGEDESVLTTQPVVSTAVDDNSLIGEYDIVVSGATAANYVFSYQNGIFVVKAGAPSSVSLTTQTLFENQPSGTMAGTLSAASDDPGATFTYSLASGEGDADNE